MKPAPLQLTDYFLTSLSIEANPDFNGTDKVAFDFDSLTVTPTVRKESDLGDNGTKWFVTLHIVQDIPAGKNVPYRFSLQMQGIVFAAPQLTGITLGRAVHANGPAMLFGAAREIIRAATGRGPWPAVIIPSTNFFSNLPAVVPAAKAEPAPAVTSPKAAKKRTVSKPR